MRTTYLAIATLTAALCLSGTVRAQDCGPVSDEANVLHGTLQATPLIDQGADVHAVSIQFLSKYGVRLADAEDAYEKACPNWRAPNGQRKANLIVIMIAPSSKLKNIFLGSSYNGMFANSEEIDSLYSKAANSYFRSGAYMDGINAAIRDLNGKVVAYHDQQKHPVQSEAPKAAETVLLWLIGLVAGFLILFLILRWRAKRREETEATEAAQQAAIRARNSATEAYRAVPKDNPSYTGLSARYADMSNSIKSDPTTDGLSANTYAGIAVDWKELERAINRAIEPKLGPIPVSTTGTRSRYGAEAARIRGDYGPPRRTAPPPTPTPVTPTPATTVVVQQGGSGNDLTTGILLGEELSDNRRSYREPDYPREEPREAPSRDDSSSSGSDSSWSSSSDDSSSSDSDSSFGGSDSGSSGGDSSW